MSTKRNLTLCLLLAAMTIVQAGCSDPAPTEPQPEVDQQGKVIQYYTAAKSGKWSAYAATHVPVAEVISKKDSQTLHVLVPLSGSAQHYIESIILMDHNHKEIKAVRFEKGNYTAKASFELPPPAKLKRQWYIVARCNLHDMWQAAVEF